MPLILWSNARQRRIQIEDGTYRRPEYTPMRVTRSGVCGSFAGSIFGATLWLLILAGLAGDWVSIGVILGGDILLFLGANALCVRDPQRYWSIVILTICALMGMTLAAINLRWTAWMHAYRQSSAYDPRNDVSLLTVNLIVLGLFVFLLALFATQYARHKAASKNQASNSGR